VRTAEEQAVATAIIELMRGVVYREHSEGTWGTLDRHAGLVRDHFEAIGVEVVVDETEGYAYLRSQEEDADAEPLPRLVKRRSLTYNVSLLLVLLRKRLVEFETTGSEGKLVLSRESIVEMLRVFLGDSTNEARVIDRVDTTIKQVADLGFLRQLRGQPDHWEVRRILKAYVDGQTLSDYAGKLREYSQSTSGAAADE
jgi:hypothetical protein